MNTKHLLLLALCTAAPSFTSHAMEQQHKYPTRGILIAFEGIDGSGKTTLAQAVNNSLTQCGFDTVLTREPGDTPLGKQIREIVLKEKNDLSLNICSRAEFLLFAADRAQHFESVIIPNLIKRKLIISDRLADSSLAYQGYGRCQDLCNNLRLLEDINKWAMQEHKPDITIFIQIPVKTALERCKKRENLSIFEHESFLHRAANGFETIYNNRHFTNVIPVDGTKSSEELTEYVCEKIKEWIEARDLLS